MIDFRRVKAVISDMDGVLWRGDQPLAGLAAFFDRMRTWGIPFALATNNSRLSPRDYVAKLAGMGIDGVAEAQIVTSGTVTAAYLQRHFPAGRVIHVLGGDGLRELVAGAGYTVTSDFDPTAAAVTVGMDQHLTYAKLKHAALTLQAGAAFIATNTDATFPAPEGLVPGAGAIVAALATASGRTAISMGKPDAPMFDAALAALNATPESALMIGDRLNTDIDGAAAVGLQTALVLTGVSTRADAESAALPPDGIFDDLPALLAAWAANQA
ncbi:MAG: HAD-IIA family hydrolase [bacterium]|nr:HAD-IIA family hydrolase [bacterium]